jgi:ribose transport system substrate-binding protein
VGFCLPAVAADKQIRLGMVNFSLCCPYFIGMSKAVEAAVYPNIKLFITDADGDAAKLTSDVEDVLARNVDGIVLSGAWLEAAPAALDAIKKAGVPVVMVDRFLKGGDYTSWVGPNNYTIGVQDGQYIADRLGGKGLLVVLRGGPADNSIGLDRTNGML